MAELSTGDGGGGKGKHSKKRAKKTSTKVDMTPMVDLAFLLLTFFMLATTFSKPKTLEITFPKKKEDTTGTKIPDELATTFLVGEETDQVFYYNGKFKPDTTRLEKVAMGKDGIRKFLLNRNNKINTQVEDLEGKLKSGAIDDSTFKAMRSKAKGAEDAPFVIIKTSKDSKYKTVIDLIDELNITNVGKYAVIDMSDTELVALLTITKPGSFTLK
jgi:biopolymer transport protein ExbD